MLETRLFILAFALLVAYMTVWFLVALQRKRLDIISLAWGGGFVLVAWMVALLEPALRTLLVAAMVTLWAGRLTIHLMRRSRQGLEDPRYPVVTVASKRSWLRAYFSIYFLQAIMIGLIATPIVFNASPVVAGLKFLFTLGYIVWAMGFYIENRADNELAGFREGKPGKVKSKVYDGGLWRFTRHPNYFGELLQWWGIGLIACQTVYGWLGLAGPALLTVMIFFTSGIPVIEARRADDKHYQEYKRRTSVLVPLPPKS